MNQIRCTGLIAFMLYGSSLPFFLRTPQTCYLRLSLEFFLRKPTHYRAFIAKNGFTVRDASFRGF
jgi:hypothetical protein